MTTDELNQTKQHYLDLGIRIGKRKFNWDSAITGFAVGILTITGILMLLGIVKW